MEGGSFDGWLMDPATFSLNFDEIPGDRPTNVYFISDEYAASLTPEQRKKGVTMTTTSKLSHAAAVAARASISEALKKGKAEHEAAANHDVALPGLLTGTQEAEAQIEDVEAEEADDVAAADDDDVDEASYEARDQAAAVAAKAVELAADWEDEAHR
jgi:hypothetical protein